MYVMYVCMYVCMYVWTCPSLAHEQLDGTSSYSVIKSLLIFGPCPVNLNTPFPKMGVLHLGPKTQNGDIL
jgi:hypothetical protein